MTETLVFTTLVKLASRFTKIEKTEQAERERLWPNFQLTGYETKRLERKQASGTISIRFTHTIIASYESKKNKQLKSSSTY